MRDIIKDALILFAITIIAGGLLGLTYSVTEEPIAVQKVIQRNLALNNVLADASFDKELDVPEGTKITNIYEAAIDGELVGYGFKMITSEGYGGDIELVVGIRVNGEISGIDIIKHAETPGLGAKADEDGFKDQFKDILAGSLSVIKGKATADSEIEAISGATITSKAVTEAVNEAVEYYQNKLAKGAN